MTKKEKISAWIAISLILQLAILFYIDYYFLGNSGIIVGETHQTYKFGNYRLHDNAENIKVSYDTRFASYESNGKLNLVDIQNNKDVHTMSFDDLTPSFHKWVPDRNRLIAIFGTTQGKSDFKIYAYDCDSKNEMEIQSITGLPRGCTIEDIQLSTLTNIIYVFIKHNDTAILYRIGIMGDKARVYPRISRFANLKQCNLKDIVVYEDPINKKIYVQEGPEAWTVTLQSGACLLGIDTTDNIYISEYSDGKCSSLKYGSLNTKVTSWHNINLGREVDPDNIIVQRDGEIFIKDESQNRIKKVRNNSVTIYEGQFLELHDNFIISLYNNRIKVIPINL